MIASNDVSASIEISPDGKVATIRGSIKEYVVDRKLVYAAAAPADRRASFSGSGLPFPNANQAFDNTPNIGTVLTDPGSGSFTIQIKVPNAYYVGLGSVYVQPKIYLNWHNGHVAKERALNISEGIAYRKLTYPWQRSSTMFYENLPVQLPVRSQEQILRDSAYNVNKEADKFWGLRPPV
jgi:hypothetical protein